MDVVVAGTRPNFVKVAPLLAELRRRHRPFLLVHTGQHYDDAMSGSFFRDLEIPEPDRNLGVGSGSHAAQTAAIIARFDEVLAEANAGVERVVVTGDVNSTLACAIAAAQRRIPVAHLEAGLRSFDREMPEELNRVLVDSLSTWLLTPSADADDNLRREGVSPARIHRVGNIMVDSLQFALARRPERIPLDERGLAPGTYGLITLHRPALVDRVERFVPLLRRLVELSEQLPMVFPVHPRTRRMLSDSQIRLPASFHVIDPLPYLEFIWTQAGARVVVTDSGGVQEETTCLGVPCVTVRNNTERPVTISEGTNALAGMDPDNVARHILRALHSPRTPRRPELWDGHTAERVVRALDQPVGPECWSTGGPVAAVEVL